MGLREAWSPHLLTKDSSHISLGLMKVPQATTFDGLKVK